MNTRMNASNYGVKRSKVKVTGLSNIILKNIFGVSQWETHTDLDAVCQVLTI